MSVKSGGRHEGRFDIDYAFVLKLTGELFAFLDAKYKDPDGTYADEILLELHLKQLA